jgi:hypothetical protein
MGSGSIVKLALAGVAALTFSACTVPSTSATRLDITTYQMVCGGAVPPPGVPACRTSPAARTVEVSSGTVVVASGTSGPDGQLVLEVVPGDFVISVPGALPYQNCDTPSIRAVAGQTTRVAQTCTLLAP